MALRIEITAYGADPIVVCDHCGKSITDALDGNCEWAGTPPTLGNRLALYVLHKHCSEAFEQRRCIVLESMELTVLLPALAHRLGLRWERAWLQTEAIRELL